MWVRTDRPCPDHDAVRILIAGHVAQNWTHAQYTDVPIRPDAYFTSAWSGHHYEAIGWLLRYRRDEWDVDLTEHTPPGWPPILRLLDPASEDPLVETAVWWQRAYRLTENGGEPPVIAELHWRPGLEGARQFLRIQLPGDAAPAPGDFDAALVARALLTALQPKLSSDWQRSTLGREFVQQRGWRLAVYCKARGITDPIALSREDVAEAIGYASEESMRNALNQRKVKTEHIKAEAYRLIQGDSL